MKHYLIVFACVALGFSVLACNQNEFVENGQENGNEGGFAIGAVSQFETKADAGAARRVQTGRIALSEPGDPDQVFLIETVEDMDDSFYQAGFETKGTPVYTETFPYDKFSTVAYVSEGNKYSSSNNTSSPSDGNNLYKYDAFGEHWPSDAPDEMMFFFAAPSDLTGETPAFKMDYGTGAISFDYVSPEAASDQADLLFTSRNISKEQYAKVAKILFYHPLAGVKFKSGNAKRELDTNTGLGEVITEITSISLTNILANGHCKVQPLDVYNGDDSNASATYKKSCEVVTWTPAETPAYSDFSISELALVNNTNQFPSTTDFEGKTVSGNVDQALGQLNLNDEKFSKTFMFIPQTTGENVVLSVEYKIGGKKYKKSVAFSGKTWEAGKLYTYTIQANHVAVKVVDAIDESNIKKDLAVTNTGNVDAYLRAAIVGNWYDTHGIQTNEYSEKDRVYFQIVCPWGGMPVFLDENGNGENNEGKVTGLDSTNWIKGSDGFYYYKYIVKPGCSTKYKLFETYKAKECPMLLYQNNKSHLELDILVQAIDAAKVGNMPEGAWETGHFTKDYDPE